MRSLKKIVFYLEVFFFYIFHWPRKNIFDARNHVGLICYEYFHLELGQFGGYGKTVERLARFFNKKDSLPKAKVLISFPYHELDHLTEKKIGTTDIVIRPQGKKNYIASFWRYAYLLKTFRLGFLLSIDYYESYEYVLRAAPHIPLIIWIRDPRGKEDWRKLALVKGELKAMRVASAEELLSQVQGEAESINRVIKLSKILKRKVVFVTNGQFLVDRAREAYGLADLKAHTLMNPLDLPPLNEITFASEPVFLFIGRFAPQKRFWIVGELAKMFPSVKFVISGMAMHEETMNPILEPYLNFKNIEYTGIIEGKRKEELFRQCWALLNTSVHEGLPVTFLEAFSYGKTVISSVNPEDLVEKYGYYTGEIKGDGYDEASLEKFAVLIRKVLYNRDEILKKGKAAREYMEKTHTFDIFEARLKEILVAEGIITERT